MEGMEKYVYDQVLFQSADIYTPGSVATPELKLFASVPRKKDLKI